MLLMRMFLLQRLLDEAESKDVRLVLPADSLEADDFSNDAHKHDDPYDIMRSIRDGWEGLDIGKKAIEEFTSIIGSAKTVLWNGPMGVLKSMLSNGTKMLAESIAGALSIIGGGDSVTAIKKFGYAEDVTFISTGGGASLELLEGKVLPGVDSPDNI